MERKKKKTCGMFLGLVDVAALLLLKKTTTPKAEEEVEEFEAFPVRTEGAMALIVAIYRANEVLRANQIMGVNEERVRRRKVAGVSVLSNDQTNQQVMRQEKINEREYRIVGVALVHLLVCAFVEGENVIAKDAIKSVVDDEVSELDEDESTSHY